jgi:hypothetical protein
MPSTQEPANGSPARRAALIACVLVLVVYFAASSSGGLNAYFTGDDAGNLLHSHKYWEHSLADVIGSCLRVATPAFRPLGGVFYFTLYKLAGFNPLPFRAVCLTLMLANLLLAFALLRRLSGSLKAALLGAILIANHPAMLELLYSSGTIYEILCFFFYFLTVLCYLVWRETRQLAGAATLSWSQLAGLLVLTGCALDSKEMAMTLPGALLLIELVYFPPRSWSWRETVRFVLRQGRGALVTGALVAPTIAVKVLTRNPLSEDTRYGSPTLRRLLRGMRAYQSFLLYRGLSPSGLSTLKWLALWAAMWVAAIALRSRPMKFGLGLLMVSLAPIALIDVRNGYMVYIPLVGWALYVGALFQWLCDSIFVADSPRLQAAIRFCLLAAAATLIVNTHTAELAHYRADFERHESDNRRIVERLRQVHPHLPPGAALLLVDDPLPPGFELLFLTRLAYADPALEVDRIKMLAQPPSQEELTRYDFVLAGNWQLHDVRGIADPRPPLEVRFGAPTGKPGEGYTVEIPELAGKTVDVIARTIARNGSDRRTIQQRCTVDASGRATLLLTPDSTPVTIQVRWVRPRGGDWISAAGELDIPR